MLTAPAPSTDPVRHGGSAGVHHRSTWLGAAALSAVGLALATSSGDVPADEGFVLCPFRRCTGGYCPGCGATRAAGALLRGDVAGSIRLHPLVVVWFVQFVAVAFWFALGPGGGRFARLRRAWVRWGTQLLLANAVAAVVVWIARMGTGSIPVAFGWS